MFQQHMKICGVSAAQFRSEVLRTTISTNHFADCMVLCYLSSLISTAISNPQSPHENLSIKWTELLRGWNVRSINKRYIQLMWYEMEQNQFPSMLFISNLWCLLLILFDVCDVRALCDEQVDNTLHERALESFKFRVTSKFYWYEPKAAVAFFRFECMKYGWKIQEPFKLSIDWIHINIVIQRDPDSREIFILTMVELTPLSYFRNTKRKMIWWLPCFSYDKHMKTKW